MNRNINESLDKFINKMTGNKKLNESISIEEAKNELQRRASQHKKKQKGMSPYTKLNGGNPEYNAKFFNHAMGSDGGDTSVVAAGGEGGGCCEGLEDDSEQYFGIDKNGDTKFVAMSKREVIDYAKNHPEEKIIGIQAKSNPRVTLPLWDDDEEDEDEEVTTESLNEGNDSMTDDEILDEIAGTLEVKDKNKFKDDVKGGNGKKYLNDVIAKCCDECKARFKKMVNEGLNSKDNLMICAKCNNNVANDDCHMSKDSKAVLCGDCFESLNKDEQDTFKETGEVSKLNSEKTDESLKEYLNPKYTDKCETVRFYDPKYGHHNAKVLAYFDDLDLYKVLLDNGKEVTCDEGCLQDMESAARGWWRYQKPGTRYGESIEENAEINIEQEPLITEPCVITCPNCGNEVSCNDEGEYFCFNCDMFISCGNNCETQPEIEMEVEEEPISNELIGDDDIYDDDVSDLVDFI